MPIDLRKIDWHKLILSVAAVAAAVALWANRIATIVPAPGDAPPQPVISPPPPAPVAPPVVTVTVDRNLKVCVPRPRPSRPKGAPGLVAERGTFWKPGQVLGVWFYPGATPATQSRCLAAMNLWSKVANVSFAPASSERSAQVRCAFLKGQGSWSVIGTASLTVPLGQPTMNLGWIDDSTAQEEVNRTVTHEAGHAIGFEHELESPVENIRWNKPAVYAWALQTQGWDTAQTDFQIFDRLTEAETIHTGFDPASIMCYPVDKSWTLDGFSVGWNSSISALDAQEAAAIYPFAAPPVNPPAKPPVTPGPETFQLTPGQVLTITVKAPS